jgi:hypothetical protein
MEIASTTKFGRFSLIFCEFSATSHKFSDFCGFPAAFCRFPAFSRVPRPFGRFFDFMQASPPL